MKVYSGMGSIGWIMPILIGDQSKIDQNLLRRGRDIEVRELFVQAVLVQQGAADLPFSPP